MGWQFVALFVLLQMASPNRVRQVFGARTIVTQWKTNDALNVVDVGV